MGSRSPPIEFSNSLLFLAKCAKPNVQHVAFKSSLVTHLAKYRRELEDSMGEDPFLGT
jgi:hypothetical protein